MGGEGRAGDMISMDFPRILAESTEHPVQVKCYSGFKANERPQSFVHAGRELLVMDIEGSWYEEDACTRARRACFRVRADDGDLYLLSCGENNEDWILHRIWRLGGR
jgi:hypothetical protein